MFERSLILNENLTRLIFFIAILKMFQVLKDVTAVEFDLLFDFMRSLEYFRTVKGRIILYKIVVDQIQIDGPFPVNFSLVSFLEQGFSKLNLFGSVNCFR